jgi:hypothetical protein
MANFTVSRLGQANLGGDTDALFLEKFAGEVITAYRNAVKFVPRHRMRTITGSHSAKFPIFGHGGAAYHTPGTQLVGTTVPHADVNINIDGLLVADRTIAQIDELKNYWEVRSYYSKDVGTALALQMDSHIAQIGVNAARSSALITDDAYQGGSVIEDVDPEETDPQDEASVYAKLFNAQKTMDEKNVPEDGRCAFVRPDVYQVLIKGLTPVDVDYNPGGNGSVAKGRIYNVAGFEIVKTNQLPNTNINSGPTAYQGDFTDTVALCMHPDAVATVKLLDLQVESAWKIEYQAWLLVAKYAVGHGILRPEFAVELSSAAS